MTQLAYINKSPIAFRGMIADMTEGNKIDTAINEEAVDVSYGTAWKQGTAGDQKLLPTTGAKVVGAAVHEHGGVYNRDLSGTLGIAAATGKAQSPGVFNIMRKGRIWTICHGGCVVNGAVFVQITTNGARVKGDFAGTDDGANAEACSQAIWRTAAAAGELAVLEVDFSAVLGSLT